jgi:hypothetical protein
MKTIGNYKVQLASIGLIGLIIILAFRTIRIEQFKNTNPSIIKAIGEYEEKSKIETYKIPDSIIGF